MDGGLKEKVSLAFFLHQRDRPLKSPGFEGGKYVPNMMPVLGQDLSFPLICQFLFVRLLPVLGPRKPIDL